MAIRRNVRSFATGAAVILAVQLSSVSEGRASVDFSGVWRVNFFITYYFCPPEGCTVSDVCVVTIAQSGTSLSLSGACDGFLNPLTAISGTIDPDTGMFSATVLSGDIPSGHFLYLQGTGTASGLSGSLTVQPPPFLTTGTFSGQRLCGNGQIDAGEACDDGNLDNFDCCDATCQYEASSSPCTDDGNQCTHDACDGAGVCQHLPLPPTTCDDLNDCTDGDTCTNGSCVGTPKSNGATCDDANACTVPDTCQNGSCQSGPPVTCAPCLSCDGSLGCVPTLDTACKQAGKSAIRLRDANANEVTWKWLQGDFTSAQELGDPQSTTDYALCIYDSAVDQNGNPRLLVRGAAPAGSSWKPTVYGFAYKSGNLLPDGMKNIRLKPGDDTKAKVLVSGKGSNLNLPPLQSIVLPITVQLKAGDGLACWEAAYGTAMTSNERLFTAQSP